MAQTKQVGEWTSPITSELIVAHTKSLKAVQALDNGDLVWIEGRPAEKGRCVLVHKASGGSAHDVTPGPDSGFNVRTRVQEYGGGEYVLANGTVYFSNFQDQRLYEQQLGGASEPKAITADDSKQRFADAVADAWRNRLIAVCEDHSAPGEAVTTISAVDLASGHITTLISGHNFFSSPRLSPDGSRLAWVAWDHPSMPWDDTSLWVADVAPDGSLGSHRKVAGSGDEAVMQPRWGPDGRLYFITDGPSGWWNVHVEEQPGEVVNLCPLEAEIGGPAWIFGGRDFWPLSDGRVLAIYSNPKRAGATLGLIDPASKKVTDISSPFTSFQGLAVSEGLGRLLLATIAGTPLRPSALVTVEVAGPDGLLASSPEDWQEVAASSTLQVDTGYLSEAQAIEFPTEGGLNSFMNYYAPRNKDCVYPAGVRPPLLVKIHGGPTAQAGTELRLTLQYWTSRGFAVADVNYGGSTGYGRPYRMRLRKQWGVVDVDDCCNAAKYLASQGLADPERLCIDGGSAGGYTTLACLAFRDVFAAGASHYGVADLELLAKETHKFESRYLDNLLGTLEKDPEIYAARSPIKALDKFNRPIAFFQGLEDEIVPPNQAELMFEALKARGLPTALVLFEGEQHGFRQAANIRRALDGELYFYAKALGFPGSMPPGLEPPAIANV